MLLYTIRALLLINPFCRSDSVCVRRARVPPDRVSWAGRTVHYILVAAVGSEISPSSEEGETARAASKGPSNDSRYWT